MSKNFLPKFSHSFSCSLKLDSTNFMESELFWGLFDYIKGQTLILCLGEDDILKDYSVHGSNNPVEELLCCLSMWVDIRLKMMVVVMVIMMMDGWLHDRYIHTNINITCIHMYVHTYIIRTGFMCLLFNIRNQNFSLTVQALKYLMFNQ